MGLIGICCTLNIAKKVELDFVYGIRDIIMLAVLLSWYTIPTGSRQDNGIINELVSFPRLLVILKLTIHHTHGMNGKLIVQYYNNSQSVASTTEAFTTTITCFSAGCLISRHRSIQLIANLLRSVLRASLNYSHQSLFLRLTDRPFTVNSSS